MNNTGFKDPQLEGKLNVACEVIEHRLSVLWSAIDSIDTKTNIILGFASAILGLLAGFYALEDKVWPFLSLALFCLAGMAYIVLAILSISAYRIKAWSYRPDVKTLLQNCGDNKYDVSQIKKWLADECICSCYDNLNDLKKKASLVNWGLVLLIIETIFLTAGLTYALFVG